MTRCLYAVLSQKAVRSWISSCIKMEKTVHTQTEMFERAVFLMKSLLKPLLKSIHVQKKNYFSVFEKSLLLGLVLSFLLTMTGFSGQCEAIENRVFRFHVLANSDSAEDQALKLKVRDRVLEYSEDLFQTAQTREDAENLAADHLQELRQIAQNEVYRQGYDYPVKAEITNMFFNTREYETVTLPAGYYDALRITIGEAEGHNWWCVMFPPMCLPAAEESQELSDVLSESQMEVVENGDKYQMKFFAVELFEKVKNWFQDR